MKNKRSARLGFVAAIWLVLSIAVFGTLIGIAWMSMNATADVSADAFVVNSVDESVLARAPILDCVDRAPFYNRVDRALMVDCVDRAPFYDCVDGEFEEVIMAYRSHSVERRVDPPQNPIAPGYLLEWIGDENPKTPGHLLEWIGDENPKTPGYMREYIGPGENPIAPGYLRE